MNAYLNLYECALGSGSHLFTLLNTTRIMLMKQMKLICSKIDKSNEIDVQWNK